MNRLIQAIEFGREGEMSSTEARDLLIELEGALCEAMPDAFAGGNGTGEFDYSDRKWKITVESVPKPQSDDVPTIGQWEEEDGEQK